MVKNKIMKTNPSNPTIPVAIATQLIVTDEILSVDITTPFVSFYATYF
jgi:hypothetical protein